MITASAAFMEKVNNGETPYVSMQLVRADGSPPVLIEDGQFWGSGISFTEAVSNEGAFEFGGAIIGAFNFTLNNFDHTFDNVDFRGAVVVPLIYYEFSDGTKEYLPKGVFYINGHRTSGNVIRCTALDGMKLLDQTQTPITYPMSVQNIVATICTANGLNLDTEEIVNGSYVIEEAPTSQDTPFTDRQILSYVCQVTGNYARINEIGEMVVSWYDFGNPYTVKSTFNGKSLWTQPIEITGLRVGIGSATGAFMAMAIDGNGNLQYMRFDTEQDEFYINSSGELIAVTKSGATYIIENDELYRTGEELAGPSENEDINILFGADDYVIRIEGNPFIKLSNAAEVCQMLSERIFGIPFRPGTIPILSNPCLQAGDVLRIYDYNSGQEYTFPVTSLTYNKSITETINCAMEDKEDVDLRLPSDYSVKVSVAQAMQQALDADALAKAAQEAAELSGYQLVISSDKGLAIAEDGVVHFTGIIYDREMNEIDPEGTEKLYRWWVMQDSKPATYLSGGKTVAVQVDDALCNYAAGIYFETMDASEGVNPFSLYGRNSGGVVLTNRAGLPLTARAAESVPT